MSVRRALPFAIAVAITLPALLAVVLAWPRASSAAPQKSSAAALDTTALTRELDRARAEALQIATAPAAPTTATPGAPGPPSAAPATSADRSVERLAATAALTERVYAARDERRKAGQSGAELRKQFTLDELGTDVTDALGLREDARWLVQRDGKVLWPAGKQLPEGASFGDDKKSATATSGALLRFCPYGEPMCLVDLTGSADAKPALVPLAPKDAPTAKLDTSALTGALERARAAADALRTDAGTLHAGAPPQTAARPWAALGAALVAALAGVALLVPRVKKIGDELVQLTGRAQTMAAGKAAEPFTSDTEEVASLASALVRASESLAGVSARATLDERRRARSVEIAGALSHAAALTDLTLRVPHVNTTTTLLPSETASGGADVSVDDAALRSIVDAANTLLEAVDHRVLRWRSHADAIVPRQENATALERRAEALRPLPQLLSDTSARLLRASLVAGLPANVQAELKQLAEALGERAKAGQSLLDALLLDLATERPGARADQALDRLRAELAATKTSASAPERVAALRDLSPQEIAERIAPEAE